MPEGRESIKKVWKDFAPSIAYIKADLEVDKTYTALQQE
jgi:hypothetical protein